MAKEPPFQFRIAGYVGSVPVNAAWTDGHLEASSELIEAARNLVESGYIFRAPTRQVPASLTDPFAALLTLIRSFGRITVASIELPLEAAWGPVFDGSGTSMTFWEANGHPVGTKGSAGDLDLGS